MNLRVNHSNTQGNTGIGNFGGGEYASRRVNLEVNHRNTYGNKGIGNFGGEEYFAIS